MGLIFENFSTDLLTFALIFCVTIYIYLRNVFNYWQQRSVKCIKPTFLLGNFGPTIFQKRSIGELCQDLYNQSSTDKFIGIWGVTRPMLMVNDPELIRNVLIKDFQYFRDRGVPVDEKNDPLSGHLFSLSGEKWKNLRAKLTPVFTSGKLKAMFSTLLDCGDALQEAIDKSAQNNEVIEVREIAARYTTNVIASVAFGNEVDSFKDPNSSFRYYGRKAFDQSWTNAFRGFSELIFPSLLQIFKVKLVDADIEEFLFSIVKQTMDYREKNNVSRKDLFQLLLQLKNQGAIQADGEWDSNTKTDGTGLTINELTAQVWIFFIAGFETSSSTLSFCLYEMSKNQEAQRKAQEEIDAVLTRHNGIPSYEAMNEMKYLEACIEETLRKYPSLPILNRVVNKAYKIPGTNTILEPGTGVVIPILGLQNDPKYYKDPEKFKPERFQEDKTFIERPYLPFGDGPRACIGTRLAKMQTKVGLTAMLRKFSYELADSMKRELVISPKLNIMAPIGGINLKVKLRSN